MIDTTWLSEIQKRTEAEYCLEINGQKDSIEWASDHFRGVIAVSDRDAPLRLSVGHLPSVIVFGKIGRVGVEFAILHLYGKTIAIIHEGVTPYQVVMVYLTSLFTSYRITGVVIEKAGPVRAILEGLLDPDDYTIEANGENLLITPNKQGVSMKTPSR